MSLKKAEMLSSLFHGVAKTFPSWSFKEIPSIVYTTQCVSVTQFISRTLTEHRWRWFIGFRGHLVMRTQTDLNLIFSRSGRQSVIRELWIVPFMQTDKNIVYDGWLSLSLHVHFSYCAKKHSLICLVDVVIFCQTACSYYVGWEFDGSSQVSNARPGALRCNKSS